MATRAIEALEAIAAGKDVWLLPRAATELLAYIAELEGMVAERDERIAVLSATCGAAETAR